MHSVAPLPGRPVAAAATHRTRAVAVVLIAAAAVVIAGCASHPDYSISPRPGATAADDPALTISQKTNRVGLRLVTPTFRNETSALPTFVLTIGNGTSTPLHISPGDVTVFSSSRPVRIYSPEEWVGRIDQERRAAAQEAAAQDTAQLQIASATRTDASTTPLIVTRTQALNQATTSGRGSAKQAAELANMLQSTTIAPGATAGGLLKLHAEDIEAGQPLRIVVTLGTEAHEFAFDVRRG